ncbi:hypothetical protein BAE44_0023780 [Dichanthelium oligosanthes]|uniref:Uncharacterized protein n=1 Tax=Dichanthelium oligosanthes TaxID=888268 RepID=A0A1E5UQQ4_9POAL|nr:hypothetical protein BAE44_0023780 [Dichanthelium oligosanthes]
MATAPAASSNNGDADSKARDAVVKSEPVDVEYAKDPVLPFASFGGKVAEDEHGDTTECSSSFGDSGFVSDDDDAESDEVESPLCSRVNVDDTPAVPHIVRNKKVTADWRKFIGPERWRCQWLELRMKDLLSQVAKYDKELALINHEKYLQLEMIKGDRYKPELQQLDLPSYETIKRRKRKRYEDNMDTLVYIKKHQIFSYYNQENKRSGTENERIGADNEPLVVDDFNNLDVEDTKSNIGSNDTLLEEINVVHEQYSLRKIVLAIECIQTRIINLQSDLSKASNKINHPQKSRKRKDSYFLHKNKNAVRPFGTTQPDEDGLTLDMLFGVNKSLVDPHIEESVDDVLINNEAVIEEEFWQFERIKKTNETYSEPIKKTIETYSEPVINVAETPIVELVNKGGPKPNKKHGSTQPKLKKKNTETDLNYPNTGNTMIVAVDTRKSLRVRKPKMF